METGNLKTPTIHVYKEINEGKHKTTKHYFIQEVINGKLILSDTVNNCLNRNFAKSSPNYWLSIRTTKFIILTGLFYNSKHDIYIGDKGKYNIKEDLIIVKFQDYQRTMIVYYFKDYYTNDINKVIHFVK